MIHELVYTSAPNGLYPGNRGFCTVAVTSGIPPKLVKDLESLSSFYCFESGDRENISSYLQLRVGGETYHVLTRVCDAGVDYSGRANYLAHHVALTGADTVVAGPAWLMSRPDFFLDAWHGEPRILAGGRRLSKGRPPAERCRTWESVAGDAGLAGSLAQRTLAGQRPLTIITPPAAPTLGLVVEALNLLEDRWSTSFATSFAKLPPQLTCDWRFVSNSSVEAAAARRSPGQTLDLMDASAEPPTGPLVDAARSGEFAAQGRTATPVEAPLYVAAPPSRGVPSQVAPSQAPVRASTAPPSLPSAANAQFGDSPQSTPRLSSSPAPARKRSVSMNPAIWIACGVTFLGVVLLGGIGAWKYMQHSEHSLSTMASNNVRPTPSPPPRRVNEKGRQRNKVGGELENGNRRTNGQEIDDEFRPSPPVTASNKNSTNPMAEKQPEVKPPAVPNQQQLQQLIDSSDLVKTIWTSADRSEKGYVEAACQRRYDDCKSLSDKVRLLNDIDAFLSLDAANSYRRLTLASVSDLDDTEGNTLRMMQTLVGLKDSLALLQDQFVMEWSPFLAEEIPPVKLPPSPSGAVVNLPRIGTVERNCDALEIRVATSDSPFSIVVQRPSEFLIRGPNGDVGVIKVNLEEEREQRYVWQLYFQQTGEFRSDKPLELRLRMSRSLELKHAPKRKMTSESQIRFQSIPSYSGQLTLDIRTFYEARFRPRPALTAEGKHVTISLTYQDLRCQATGGDWMPMQVECRCDDKVVPVTLFEDSETNIKITHQINASIKEGEITLTTRLFFDGLKPSSFINLLKELKDRDKQNTLGAGVFYITSDKAVERLLRPLDAKGNAKEEKDKRNEEQSKKRRESAERILGEHFRSRENQITNQVNEGRDNERAQSTLKQKLDNALERIVANSQELVRENWQETVRKFDDDVRRRISLDGVKNKKIAEIYLNLKNFRDRPDITGVVRVTMEGRDETIAVLNADLSNPPPTPGGDRP